MFLAFHNSIGLKKNTHTPKEKKKKKKTQSTFSVSDIIIAC